MGSTDRFRTAKSAGTGHLFKTAICARRVSRREKQIKTADATRSKDPKSESVYNATPDRLRWRSLPEVIDFYVRRYEHLGNNSPRWWVSIFYHPHLYCRARIDDIITGFLRRSSQTDETSCGSQGIGDDGFGRSICQDRFLDIAQLRYEMPSKFRVGAIHELPLTLI